MKRGLEGWVQSGDILIATIQLRLLPGTAALNGVRIAKGELCKLWNESEGPLSHV